MLMLPPSWKILAAVRSTTLTPQHPSPIPLHLCIALQIGLGKFHHVSKEYFMTTNTALSSSRTSTSPSGASAS